MDASTLEKLLNSLRSSDAFINLATSPSSGAPNQEGPSQTQPAADAQPKTNPDDIIVTSQSIAVSSRISSLLSQLGPKLPGPDPPPEKAVPEDVGADTMESVIADPYVPEEPTTDLKSMGYVESLSRIEPLLRNTISSNILRKLQDDQKEVETRLWSSRQAILTAHEQKVRASCKKALIVTGVEELEPRESQQLEEELAKALNKFDREQALPTWDALVKRQQEALENLGVPAMFVTSNVTERSRQQRLIRLLEEGLAAE
ncbi:hypothetical protein FRB94_006776 [Tulasnella sp. JGI-2019a]|nr:hypothetical protein FRB94_006776 [Tulasnella sp. JGI-2019a]KAG9016225.1 hypothetical protein FRB93_011699 [Tulasnella sp. JGI-2019a]KAG9036461.1 hypothetical protein FRB95_008759 [Tulasnella sp. JGI-2019a]